MRVAIVGAGIAGLAAARILQQNQIEAVVYEAEDHVGGRAETIVLHGIPVDTGLQSYTPRGMSIENFLLNLLPQNGLTRIEKPIYLLNDSFVLPGSPEKNAQPRYTYTTGANHFPQLLAEGLDIRISTKIETIERSGQKFLLESESFDAVILSPPAPETRRLLQTLGSGRNITNARYRPCLSICLGFSVPLRDVPYSALLSLNRTAPLLWLGIETSKCPRRAPEGKTVFVAQLGPLYSREHFQDSDESLLAVVIPTLIRLYGAAFQNPDWVYVRRWSISQPESVALFENVNPPGTRVIICGDGTVAGRAENAFESGVMAAKRILALMK